jgi:FKBP-type peptidyl-prolyl cis-trans isomerase (trigger factor)
MNVNKDVNNKQNSGNIIPIKYLDDGSIEISISIAHSKIQSSYKKAVENLSKNIEVKGFRPGKAPINLAEKQIKKESIFEEIIKELVPEAYLEIIKSNNLKPIVNPQIQIVSAQENKDWLIKAITCETPKIILDGYKEIVKKSQTTNIWIPGKDKNKTQVDQNQKMDEIFRSLLEFCSLKIPNILVEEEINHMLSRLIQQTEKLGLTIEQYLQSVGKSSEQLKEEYQKQATDTLKLEFILMQISKDENINISEQEIDKMIASIPDEKTKISLQNPQQRAYIEQILKKQRVIDNLLAL